MKTSFQARQGIRKESGQAMVETVIVTPLVLFFMLGVVQMTLMHQSGLMLEYAAFNAARTGSVWNADRDKMQRAALLSMIASRPSWPIPGSNVLNIGTIDSWLKMGAVAVEMIGLSEVGSVFDDALGTSMFSLITVDILSPVKDDLQGKAELDFDSSGADFAKRRLGQLTIRVRYYYELMIPFANQFIWTTWYLGRSEAVRRMVEWNNMLNRIQHTTGYDLSGLRARTGLYQPFKVGFDGLAVGGYGQGAFISRLIAEMAQSGSGASNPYECVRYPDWMAMAVLPDVLGTRHLSGGFMIPMVTAHTIRMQSNIFEQNLQDRDDVLCNDL